MSDKALAIRKPPEPSKSLALVIAQHDAAAGVGYEWFRAQPAAIVAEAKALLPAMERFLAPPSDAKGADRWLRRLRGACIAITDFEYAGRLEAIGLSSGDLPAWAWNDDALREACRMFKFFPTAAEVDALVRPVARRANMLAMRLKWLASAKPIPVEDDRTVPIAGVAKAIFPSRRSA